MNSSTQPRPVPDLVLVRRALVSVSDKAGLVPFVRALVERGIEIVSTGGTAKALAAAAISVTPVERVTGFPEIMDGRVKTLHPMVHGGLLGVRDEPSHQDAMREHGIQPIDLVCVNLYPFERTIERAGVTFAEAIENIDIGGPSMVRSAAKNHAWVTVVTNPNDYERVMEELRSREGCTTIGLRSNLAAAAFGMTARYDAAITAYLDSQHAGLAESGHGHGEGAVFPPFLNLAYVKGADLRYGENPHQPAALYAALNTALNSGPKLPNVVGATQLHGKELSYNNIADATAALELADALGRLRAGPSGPMVGACVIKHTNPCGAAVALTCVDAVDEAIAGDPLAAYGGILAVTAEIDTAAAGRLCRNDVFLEVVVAPSYSAGALETLKARWANLRILVVEGLGAARGSGGPGQMEYTFVSGGLLVQRKDEQSAPEGEIQHRAGPMPTPETLHLVSFLEIVGRAVTSNAVVIGGHSPERGPGVYRIFGTGAGQMDRVNSCKIAVAKAKELAQGAAAYGDAFFPFSDGPQALIKAGVTTIAHAGGSKRDSDTFELCQANGVTCLTTGLRHFRH